ncbi:MAG: DUF3459 domain-containing protein, partial [Deltaproteobacteria bacterium]|nr:DUF3459 domain-containing protein [Deltaproteobacteria bacterium]
PEGVFGPSEIIDHGAYRFIHDAWTGVAPEDLILYEVHVGAFSPEGTYDGLRRRLADLADLGITGIKLMPVATSAGDRNWGYDGVFHFAPYPPYGRPAALQRLVDDTHGVGIAILIDVVTNHFGPEGNAMWSLARSFFHRASTTAWGPGPRFERETVNAYFEQMAWHLAHHYHVDGLRVDAVHAIPAADRWPHIESLARGLARGASAGLTTHLILESTENEASHLQATHGNVNVSQLNFDLQRATHRLLTGEAHGAYAEADDTGDALASCLDGAFFLRGQMSEGRGRIVGEATDSLTWPSIINYLVNHDTCGNRYLGQRLQTFVDRDRFNAARAMLLLHPATPYLFMGQEWATEQPFFFFTDFSDALGQRVSRGRLAGFEELDPSLCPITPPGPQDLQALLTSRLDWNEQKTPSHHRALTQTRSLLALRQKVRPQMDGSIAGSRAWRIERAFFVEIRRIDGRGTLLLATNLGENPIPLPPCPSSPPQDAYTLLYTTRDLDALPEGSEAQIPARSTSLWRGLTGP